MHQRHMLIHVFRGKAQHTVTTSFILTAFPQYVHMCIEAHAVQLVSAYCQLQQQVPPVVWLSNDCAGSDLSVVAIGKK